SDWTDCSKSCGGGIQSRRRLCDSPSPEGSGSYCEGLGTEVRACNTDHCPVSGGWCEWSEWTPCSRTCGAESVSRYRSCSCPEPKAGGDPCPGEQETHNGIGACLSYSFLCVCVPLIVHGSWSSWSAWSECDGCAGSSVRTRQCNSPPARFGGLPCLGESRQSRRCHDNATVCPGRPCRSVPGCHVDGGWGQWGAWSECSVPCGGGVTFRRRLCDNPAPQAGGRGCLGTAEQKKDCNMQMCTGSRLLQSDFHVCRSKVTWGMCSLNRLCVCMLMIYRDNSLASENITRVISEIQSRHRLCAKPPCSGSAHQEKACNLPQCPGLTVTVPSLGHFLAGFSQNKR
uniref:Uncharacterized protein n=1 Tax=Poecilia mexicana TaxID=48701 RepID=A0A3B3Y4G4_9TELE